MEELLLYLLKSAVLLSIFFGVYQLLLRNETCFQANRHFLLAGILAAAVLPAVEFVRHVSIPMTFSETPMPLTSGSENFSLLSSEINWWEIAGGIYTVMAGVLLLRFLIQLFSLSRIIQKGSLRLDGRFRIIRTTQELSPFSFFHYIVWNPKMHAEEDLNNILEHEKTHATQWHSADVLLVNLTAALLWFNPLSWRYRKSVVQNLEYIADRQAVSAVPRSGYQQTLVKLAIRNHQPVLANNFNQSFIKKRILMLNKTQNQHHSLWKFGTIVPLLLVFMFFFNLRTEAQVSSDDTNITEVSVVISPKATQESLDKFEKFMVNQEVDVVPPSQNINPSEFQNTSSHSPISVQEEKPLIVLNEKRMPKDFNLNTINPTDIAWVNVLKNDAAKALYGTEAGKRGVIMVVTKDYAKDNELQKTDSSEHIIVFKKGKNGATVDFKGVPEGKGLKDNALYVVNGEVMKTDFDISSIEVDDIESVNVLKDASATAKYGKKGEGGVIEIRMKE